MARRFLRIVPLCLTLSLSAEDIGTYYDFETNQGTVINYARLERETPTTYEVWVESFNRRVVIQKSILIKPPVPYPAKPVPEPPTLPAPPSSRKNRLRIGGDYGQPYAGFTKFFTGSVGAYLAYTRNLEAPFIRNSGFTLSAGYDRYAYNWTKNVAHFTYALLGPDWFLPWNTLLALGARLQGGITQLYVITPEYYAKNLLPFGRLTLYLEFLVSDTWRINTGIMGSTIFVSSPSNYTLAGFVDVSLRF